MNSKQRHKLAKEKFDKIITPEVLKEAEEMSKQLRKISVEELYRPFTI